MQDQSLIPPSPQSKPYSQAYKQHHLASWHASGLSMSEYCRRNNLSISNLSNWNARSKNKEVDKTAKLQSIKCVASSSPRLPVKPIEIILLNGIKIRLADLSQFASVLKMINGQTCYATHD